MAALISRIVGVLERHRGRVLSAEAIASEIYADREDGGPDWAADTIRTAIRRHRPPGLRSFKARSGGYALGEAEPPTQWQRVIAILRASPGHRFTAVALAERLGTSRRGIVNMMSRKGGAAGWRLLRGRDGYALVRE